MNNLLRRWFRKYFSDPEGVILAILLLVGLGIVIFFGNMLAPVFASLVIAYLLEGLVGMLERRRIPRLAAVLAVFIPFLALLLVSLLVLMPMLVRQLTDLVQQLPTMITRGQELLLMLPEQYPNFVSEAQIQDLIFQIRTSVAVLGQNVLALSLSTITSVVTFIVYLVLMPVLVFFFLKDKDVIIGWVAKYLPRERGLATRVWQETDVQIGNYVRGKFVEIVINAVVSYIVFALLGLNFAMLLGVLVGVSVIIPYIGAIAVTFPIAIIAYFQWGWGPELAWVMAAYAIIQALDANVLVPMLFSEVVNLHPVAIIVAILIFGGFWGLWGVFFAIPLATLVKAVINAWPRALEDDPGSPGAPVRNEA